MQLNHNDPLNYESITSRSQSPANLRRELPADLSDEALEREAGELKAFESNICIRYQKSNNFFLQLSSLNKRNILDRCLIAKIIVNLFDEVYLMPHQRNQNEILYLTFLIAHQPPLIHPRPQLTLKNRALMQMLINL